MKKCKICRATKKKKKKEDDFVEDKREDQNPIFFNHWSSEPEFEEPEQFNQWNRRKVRKYNDGDYHR